MFESDYKIGLVFSVGQYDTIYDASTGQELSNLPQAEEDAQLVAKELQEIYKFDEVK